MPDETDARVRRQLESHLTFAAAVLSSPRLDVHRRELDERLSAIRARHADQSLYLAVVGEFSSGKSTFINALIGEPLLPTSAAITTAVPPELAPGAAPEVRLQLAGAERTWVLPRDNAALRKELGRRGVSAQIPADARDALKSLVVSDEIGALVSSVRYTCQGDFLGEDIVVIDTPGLDASDDHDLIAQRVVADRADAFVVLTASNSAFRRYLEGFLRSSLKEHLHQSVFVVTKMDQVDDDEIARSEPPPPRRRRRLTEPPPRGPFHSRGGGPALSAGGANADDW